MQSQLIRLTDPEGLVAAGLPWDSVNKARWAFRKRRENGLAAAFLRIGKTIFVDPAKAHELVRQQPAA